MNGTPSVDWTHFAAQLRDLLPLVGFVAVIVGLLLVISGLYRWAMVGRRGDISTGGAIARIVVGSLLVSIHSTIDAVTQTLFGENAANLLSYVPPQSNAGGDIIKVIIYAVEIVGFFAVCKGLYQFATAWDGRGSISAGVAHIIGGIFAINIIEFLHVVANTMGGSMVSVVNNIFG